MVAASPGVVPAPVVPCPVLVGRSAEVELLASALATARDGTGAVVFIVGEVGIGKSRLVQEVVSQARATGARVFAGRAVPGSAGAAFRPLTEALLPAVADSPVHPSLDQWRPALGAILPTLEPGPNVDVTTPVRGEAVVRLLRSVSPPAGGVLVLEDLHWADHATVAVVEHLVDHLAAAPVLCVVTVRSEEPRSPALDLVERVAARRSAAVLRLERLNEAQVAAMVHSCTGGTDAEAVRRVVSMADGVPFLVEEMLVTPGLPRSFADGVRARVGELTDAHRRVLQVASAFGRHFDWRLLAPAAGVDPDVVVEALERGVDAQLLAVEGDGFRFRHSLTAEAVFRSVSPPRRQALARAALAALDSGSPDGPRAGREVAAALAERAGYAERAAHLWLALGEDAVRLGALDTAIAACERACEVAPDGALLDAARDRLVHALALAGRVDDAVALSAQVVDHLSPSAAAAIRLRVAGAAARAARWSLVEDQLTAARAAVAASPSPALRAELAAQEAELAFGTDRTQAAVEQAHEALHIARAEGLAEQECEALQLLGRCARRSSLDEAERWFREAAAAAEASGLAVWQLRARHELGTIALLDRSDVAALLDAQALAERLGAIATAAVLDIEIAEGYAGHDDLSQLEHYARQAVRRGMELGMDLVVAYGWMHLGAAAGLRGDDEQAVAAEAAALAAGPGNRDIEALVAGAQTLSALFHDDLSAALDAATRFTELVRDSPTAPPAHHRAARPMLLAMAGNAHAIEAIEEVEASPARVNRGARGWLMMARAVVTGRQDPAAARALAVEADALLEPMPGWRSLARRLVAEAAATDGWAVPDEWLPEAEAYLRRIGFPAAAAACRRLRGAPSDGVPDPWRRRGITRREADVLALVAEGRTNREIAEHLYLSVRTVEKHVESLLRKTQCSTRTQLARWAATT